MDPSPNDLTVPAAPPVSTNPDGSFSNCYTPLDEMVLPEEVPDPTDIATRTSDAALSNPDGYGHLKQMDLPENTELDHKPDYVIDCIVSAGLIDDIEVCYKVCWYGYEPKDDTWLPMSEIPSNFVARYWSRTGYTERDLKKRDVPGHKFALARA